MRRPRNRLDEVITGQGRLWEARRKGQKVPKPPILYGNEPYFSAEALADLTKIKSDIDRLRAKEVKDFFLVAFLSILRHVSRANVKKMNTEIDETKREKPVLPTFFDKLHRMQRANEAVASWPKVKITVQENDSRSLPLDSASVGMAVLHPPYLTNTAFSESVQLPLAWLGVKHTSVWKRELRCRGSFLHEPDGLRKYLVDWHRVLKETHRVLRPHGHGVVVVGDGQIDYVRIPARMNTASTRSVPIRLPSSFNRGKMTFGAWYAFALGGLQPRIKAPEYCVNAASQRPLTIFLNKRRRNLELMQNKSNGMLRNTRKSYYIRPP